MCADRSSLLPLPFSAVCCGRSLPTRILRAVAWTGEVTARVHHTASSACLKALILHPCGCRMYYLADRSEGHMRNSSDATSEARRGTAPADEAYLKRVGERVRLGRARRGMSRKILSKASGVSERYLAELERGAGNASLLVLRQIAEALSIETAALVSDQPERPIDLTLAIHQLERLSPSELSEARRLISQRFGIAGSATQGRIALIGLRGAGKTTLGQLTAEALAVPFIELDREIERASGME